MVGGENHHGVVSHAASIQCGQQPPSQRLTFSRGNSDRTWALGQDRIECGHPGLQNFAKADQLPLGNSGKVARAFVELGHEVACHGYRWIHYQDMPEDIERDEFDAVSRHAIARDAAGAVVATGRLLPDGHIGRMAVAAPLYWAP